MCFYYKNNTICHCEKFVNDNKQSSSFKVCVIANLILWKSCWFFHARRGTIKILQATSTQQLQKRSCREIFSPLSIFVRLFVFASIFITAISPPKFAHNKRFNLASNSSKFTSGECSSLCAGGTKASDGEIRCRSLFWESANALLTTFTLDIEVSAVRRVHERKSIFPNAFFTYYIFYI